MMQTDVKAVYKNATGQLGIAAASGTRVRIKGLWMATPVGAGSVVIRDGSSTGTVLLQVDTAAAIFDANVFIPGEGILFQGDPHVTLTSVTSVTVFYG
jgi:hypothetical protein